MKWDIMIIVFSFGGKSMPEIYWKALDFGEKNV
jgi:hypothetical protein